MPITRSSNYSRCMLYKLEFPKTTSWTRRYIRTILTSVGCYSKRTFLKLFQCGKNMKNFPIFHRLFLFSFTVCFLFQLAMLIACNSLFMLIAAAVGGSRYISRKSELDEFQISLYCFWDPSGKLCSAYFRICENARIAQGMHSFVFRSAQ